MRTELAIALAMALACGSQAAAPTYSCFDPPDEGQTNPLGEGFEDVVGAECCEALLDESDIAAGRLVFWDPVNCNHGPGLFAITEDILCRAHDTDGCRFCRESCDDYEGLCITCDEVAATSITGAPTSSPIDFTESPTMGPDIDTPAPSPTTTDMPLMAGTEIPLPAMTPVPATPATDMPMTPAMTEMPVTPAMTEMPVTPAMTEMPMTPAMTEMPMTPAMTEMPMTPAMTEMPMTPAMTEMPMTPAMTEMPVGIFPETAVPVTAAPVTTAPVVNPGDVGDGGGNSDCFCVSNMSDVEMEVLTRRGKTMRCDPSCSDGSDLTWGTLHCNYFALGQECRACSDSCTENSDGIWFDQYGIICKPCSVVV